MAISQIVSDSIAANTVSSSLIANGSILSAHVANGAITSAHITSVANTAITGVINSNQLSTTSQYVGFKNRIINGSMVIGQRNAGASVTASTINAETYTLDRWSYYATQASKYSVQQNAGSVTPPVGFSNYLGVTSASAYSVISTDWFTVKQSIEGFNGADLGWGTANAKTVTLSFQVYSSLTGTFGGSIRNVSGNRCYPFNYIISSSNTWTQVNITIPGDTAGTWTGATNGTFAQIFWGLGVGSSNSGTAGAWAAAGYGSPTGSVSVVGTSGATWYITGVQFEVGAQATSFDFRNYGIEESMCKRYYERNSYQGTAWGQNGTDNRTGIKWNVYKRTSPSVTFESGYVQYGPGGQLSITSISSVSSTQTGALLTFSASGGQTTNYPSVFSVGLYVDSEL